MAPEDDEERQKTRLLEAALRRGRLGVLTGVVATVWVALTGAVIAMGVPEAALALGVVGALRFGSQFQRNRRAARSGRLLLEDPTRFTRVTIDWTGVHAYADDESVTLVTGSSAHSLLIRILQERCTNAVFEKAGTGPKLPHAEVLRLGNSADPRGERD